VHIAEGLLAWQLGNTAEALAIMREAPAGILRTGAEPFAAVVLLDLAELSAELGDVALAVYAAGELAKIADHIDRDLYRAMAAMGSAWSGFGRRQIERGRCSPLCARSRSCRIPVAEHFGRAALDLLARSLIGTDPAAAINALEEAATAFDACGAVWRRDRAAHRLRTLGARVEERPPQSAVPSLSLDASGRSRGSRSRAKRRARSQNSCFISERTVETHLASAYGKLGVRSKLDLVRRASEFSLNR